MGLHKCHKKQQLYRKTLKQTSTYQDHIKYKTYRNKLKQILRRAKEDFYRNKCIEYRQNTSRLWKMINKLTNKTNDKTDIIEYLRVGNQDYYEHKIIAEEFAKHFSYVGKQYAGHDNLSNILLKQIKESITYPLTVISNHSITEGEFPNGMEAVDVSPLYKSKERYMVTNYRPNSLLITMSKILEKVVYSRVYNFLVETEQLYQSQYGFRTGHSCQNTMSELIGNILKNQEENKLTIGVFIDLSKAFDTLSHNILIRKLQKHEIRGTP